MTERKHERIDLPKDGAVSILANPTITEEEIAADLEWITIALDGMYNQLDEAMKPFQDEWKRDPKWALLDAALNGAAKGGGAWVEDLGDLFKGETWVAVGQWIGNLGADVADTVADYAKKQGKRIAVLVEKPEKTIFSWSWWVKQAKEEVGEAQKTVEEAHKTVTNAAKASAEAVRQANAIWKHRKAICKLPELIAAGDVKAVEHFVDTVIKDIDPKLAKQIRESKDFYTVLALMDDPDSVLTYLTYVHLTLEAIPPNFYAYIGGTAGVYVLCEAILLIVAALFSGGVAAGARLTALSARIIASSAKVATASKKIENAMKAIHAFKEVITRFVRVADDLRLLGGKINFARQRGGVRLKGPTKTTLEAKHRTTKRDRKCRICGSTKHKTPAYPQRGCLIYK
jgi:hypothetical protein